MSSSQTQSPGDPAGFAQPNTAEIPVMQPAAAPVTKQLPPHPGATAFGAHTAPAAEAAQPTGPVDFVPGLPGLGTPPPPPSASAPPVPAIPVQVPPAEVPAAPAPMWPETLEGDGASRKQAGTRVSRLPQDRGPLVAIGLAALALLLLQLGLTFDFGPGSLWDVVPLWSAFATAAVLVGLLALLYSATPGGRSRAGLAWRVGAGGLVCLSVFWLLVALPGADGDRGFLLTAALGSLGAALWVAAARD